MIDRAYLSSVFADLRPSGGFRCIYVDPPWRIEMYSAAGLEKSPQAHYDCMGIDDIKALPVELLAAQNCHIWIWATWPMLESALSVLPAWGFDYKTGGAWFKEGAKGGEAFGTGYWFRSACEPFLLGTRGAPKVLVHNMRNTIHAVALQHSRKPVEARKMLEQITAGPRIELFARQRAPGWVAWGNQVDRFPVTAGPDPVEPEVTRGL